MATTVTLQQIRRLLGEKVWGGRGYGTFDAAGGSATTVTTTSHPFANTYYSGDWIEGALLYRPDATPAEERRVDSFTAGATATFTSSPNWTDTSPGSETVEVWKMPPDWGITQLTNIINRGLYRCFYIDSLPLPGITDGDMRTSGVSNWTDSSAASSKITTDGRVWQSPQGLLVTNSGTDGYTRPASNYLVVPSKSYHFETTLKAITGTAKIVIWDATNSVAIQTITTSDTPFLTVKHTFTAPAGCKAVQVRLGGSEATAVVAYSYVDVHAVDDVRMQVSTAVVNEKWVNGFFCYSSGSSTATNYVYRADTRLKETDPFSEERLKPTWIAPNEVERECGLGSQTIWMSLERPYVVPRVNELSVDTDTTPCPLEYAVAGAAKELWESLSRPGHGVGFEDLLAQQGLADAVVEFDHMSREYKPREKKQMGSLWVAPRRQGPRLSGW